MQKSNSQTISSLNNQPTGADAVFNWADPQPFQVDATQVAVVPARPSLAESATLLAAGSDIATSAGKHDVRVPEPSDGEPEVAPLAGTRAPKWFTRSVGLLAISAIAAVGAASVTRGGSSSSETPQARPIPPATAAPSPTFAPKADLTTIPTTTLAPTPTTASSIAQVAPRTPLSESLPSSTTTTAAAVKAETAKSPEVKTLSTEELDKIVKSTGYEGLRNYNLNVAYEFASSGGDRNVVLQVGNTEVAVSQDELKAAVAAGEAEATAGKSFTAKKLNLGPADSPRDIEFTAGSTKITGKPMTHYFLYSNGVALEDLSKPVVAGAGFERSSTIVRAGSNLSVSMIVNSKQDVIKNTAIEARQATVRYSLSAKTEAQLDAEHNADTSKPDLSNLVTSNTYNGNPDWLQLKQLLSRVGSEIGNNSKALAFTFSREGKSYAVYADEASNTTLGNPYRAVSAHYNVEPYADYAALPK